MNVEIISVTSQYALKVGYFPTIVYHIAPPPPQNGRKLTWLNGLNQCGNYSYRILIWLIGWMSCELIGWSHIVSVL